MKDDSLDTMDKSSVSAVLWLGDDPHRTQVLRELRESMTPGQRSRLNSPISARQRVEQVLKARQSGNEDGLRASPVVLLRTQLAERDRKIAQLEQQLAKSDGSLFDLKHDTADDIAAAIVGSVGESKAKGIASQIAAKLKQKQNPAG